MQRANLKKAREDLNLSQSELASKLGIAEISVRSYENGTRNPSNQVVKSYVDFFERDPINLFPDIFLPLFDTKGINEKSKEAVK